MSKTFKILFILALILLSVACKRKKLKIIKIPTGENVYFTDEIYNGGTSFESNLQESFDGRDGNFTNGKYYYLILSNNFEYSKSVGTTKTFTHAIFDTNLNLTYVYKEAKIESGTVKSKGSGIFIVITNEAPPTPPETSSLADGITPPEPPETPVITYVGISIKKSTNNTINFGESLYITDTATNMDNIDWKHDIIIDSRERSLEDMWLKNAQDNRVPELTMENSARVIKDNYLMVYIFKNAITPSRAVYYGFNTSYFIGIELTRAGKEIYLSYTPDDLLTGNITTSPEDIDWTNMSFVGYTTRIEGAITNMPASIRQYDTYEPEYD